MKMAKLQMHVSVMKNLLKDQRKVGIILKHNEHNEILEVNIIYEKKNERKKKNVRLSFKNIFILNL